MTEAEKQIADLQRLCERARLILGENWDNYTDKEGYGPSSLLHDLEKASKGKEVKDLRLMNDELVRICNQQADKIKKLEAI